MEKLKGLVFDCSVDIPYFLTLLLLCFKMPVVLGASRQYILVHGRAG